MKTYFILINCYLRCFSLVAAIIFFGLETFGIASTGTIGAILSLAYAGLNYLIISQINSSFGILSGLVGYSFGTAGITAIIIGSSYLYFNKSLF